VSKHSQDETAEDQTTVPADTDTDTETEKAEDEATDESTEKTEEPTEVVDDEPSESAEAEAKPKRSIQWGRVFAYGVLPAVALLLALGAGYLKWMDNSVRDAQVARDEAMQAAKDSTVAMLSYKPDTVEKQLGDARSLLTGDFRESYTSLTNDVVIPGAKQKQISAVATVPAAASVSAEPNHAVVLVFVNQTVIVGQDAPTDTASSVRVTLEKIDGHWLISKFDPV
jgi:Mce-associated membrane protein